MQQDGYIHHHDLRSFRTPNEGAVHTSIDHLSGIIGIEKDTESKGKIQAYKETKKVDVSNVYDALSPAHRSQTSTILPIPKYTSIMTSTTRPTTTPRAIFFGSPGRTLHGIPSASFIPDSSLPSGAEYTFEVSKWHDSTLEPVKPTIAQHLSLVNSTQQYTTGSNMNTHKTPLSTLSSYEGLLHTESMLRTNSASSSKPKDNALRKLFEDSMNKQPLELSLNFQKDQHKSPTFSSPSLDSRKKIITTEKVAKKSEKQHNYTWDLSTQYTSTTKPISPLLILKIYGTEQYKQFSLYANSSSEKPTSTDSNGGSLLFLNGMDCVTLFKNTGVIPHVLNAQKIKDLFIEVCHSGEKVISFESFLLLLLKCTNSDFFNYKETQEQLPGAPAPVKVDYIHGKGVYPVNVQIHSPVEESEYGVRQSKLLRKYMRVYDAVQEYNVNVQGKQEGFLPLVEKQNTSEVLEQLRILKTDVTGFRATLQDLCDRMPKSGLKHGHLQIRELIRRLLPFSSDWSIGLQSGQNGYCARSGTHPGVSVLLRDWCSRPSDLDREYTQDRMWQKLTTDLATLSVNVQPSNSPDKWADQLYLSSAKMQSLERDLSGISSHAARRQELLVYLIDEFMREASKRDEVTSLHSKNLSKRVQSGHQLGFEGYIVDSWSPSDQAKAMQEWAKQAYFVHTQSNIIEEQIATMIQRYIPERDILPSLVHLQDAYVEYMQRKEKEEEEKRHKEEKKRMQAEQATKNLQSNFSHNKLESSPIANDTLENTLPTAHEVSRNPTTGNSYQRTHYTPHDVTAPQYRPMYHPNNPMASPLTAYGMYNNMSTPYHHNNGTNYSSSHVQPLQISQIDHSTADIAIQPDTVIQGIRKNLLQSQLEDTGRNYSSFRSCISNHPLQDITLSKPAHLPIRDISMSLTDARLRPNTLSSSLTSVYPQKYSKY